VLERSRRWPSVLLPLLFSAVAGSTVLAGDQSLEFLAGRDPMSGAGSLFTSAGLLGPAARDCDCRLASFAADLLAPPHETPSSYAQHLPAVPKPALMVLVGFFCVSLVRDRKTWFAVATFLLSFGHYWLTAVPQCIACHCHRKHLERRSPRNEVVLPLRLVPLCLLSPHVSCFPALSGHDEKDSDGSSAIVSRYGASGRLLPGSRLHIDQMTSLGSQLLLPQMPRGPPSAC